MTEQLAIAKILLEEFHADPKLVNKEGQLPQDAARENEQEELARYLSGVSGVPLASLSEAEEGGDEEEGEAGEIAQGEGDDALASQRADEMMRRVEALMRRAQARQQLQQSQSTPDQADQDTQLELTDAEEEELRRLVGEGVVRQLLEGWQRGVMEGEAESGQQQNS